jgi:pimeloyl-ACP methyl ester carboxylesterase
VTLVLVPLIGMPRAARLGARRLFPLPWQHSLRERAIAALSAVPTTHYLGAGRALLRWSAAERLNLLKAKALMIAAENDFTPLDEKRDLARRIGADLVVIRGSRHGTPFDAARATNAALLALLNDQPLPAAERWICDPAADSGPLPYAGTIAEEHAFARIGDALRM